MSEKQFWVHQSGHVCTVLYGDPTGSLWSDSASRQIGRCPDGSGWVYEPDCSGPMSAAAVEFARQLNGGRDPVIRRD